MLRDVTVSSNPKAEPVERQRLQQEVLQPGALLQQQGGQRLPGGDKDVSNWNPFLAISTFKEEDTWGTILPTSYVHAPCPLT